MANDYGMYGHLDADKEDAGEPLRNIASQSYTLVVNSAEIDPLLTDAGVQERFEEVTYGQYFLAIPNAWDVERLVLALNRISLAHTGSLLFYENWDDCKVANVAADGADPETFGAVLVEFKKLGV